MASAILTTCKEDDRLVVGLDGFCQELHLLLVVRMDQRAEMSWRGRRIAYADELPHCRQLRAKASQQCCALRVGKDDFAFRFSYAVR